MPICTVRGGSAPRVVLEFAPLIGVKLVTAFEFSTLNASMSFTGRACSEPRLLALAYAFEQATHKRVPPPGAP